MGKTNSTITPQDPIYSKTPQVLDEIMERAALCGSLSQYIKLKPQKLSQKGRFVIHQHYRGNENLASDADTRARFENDPFQAAVAKYFGYKSPLTDQQRAEVRKAGGYYERSSDTVNLPSTGVFGSALHESVHRLSGPSFQNLLGHFLNEGITQFFTDIIIQDELLPSHTNHSYGPNLKSAQRLVSLVGGLDLPAQVYFQNSTAAHAEMMVKLGLIPSVNKMRYITQAEIEKAVAPP